MADGRLADRDRRLDDGRAAPEAGRWLVAVVGPRATRHAPPTARLCNCRYHEAATPATRHYVPLLAALEPGVTGHGLQRQWSQIL
jgi:hypothetical protein